MCKYAIFQVYIKLRDWFCKRSLALFFIVVFFLFGQFLLIPRSVRGEIMVGKLSCLLPEAELLL